MIKTNRTSADIEADREEAKAFWARMTAPRIVGRMRGHLEMLAAIPSRELAACVAEARGFFNTVDIRNPINSANTRARIEGEKVQKAQEAIEAQIDAELEAVAQARRDTYRDQKRRQYVDAATLAKMPAHRVHGSTAEEIAANKETAQAHARRIGRRDPEAFAQEVRDERFNYAHQKFSEKTEWSMLKFREQQNASGEQRRVAKKERLERIARRRAYKAALASGQLEVVGMTPERAFEISLAAYDKSKS